MNNQRRMLLVVWLTVGALAQGSACSSTSKGEDVHRDAATRADTLFAGSDAPPLRDEGGTGTKADAPTDVAAIDARGSLLDAPVQDARVSVDAPDPSPDLVAPRDIAEAEAKPRPDGKDASRDSVPSQDAVAAETRLPDGGAEARGDTGGMVPVSDPGLPVYSLTREGKGSCSGKTVRSLLDQIGAADPSLDGMSLYTGYKGMQTAFVYAFARDDGGFAFVFEVGSGDCPSGCIDHEYRYFQTAADCVPGQVGHYVQKSNRACGTPMWDVPANPVKPSTSVCP